VTPVDRFVEDRRARWSRLGTLTLEANGRVERLAPDDVLELGRLYRGASSDLAVARRDFPLDAATERLNDLVAAAHALVYSESPTSGRRLRRLLLRELPASVRANSRFTAISFLVFAVPLVATFAIGLLFPAIAATALPAETRQHLAVRRLWTGIPERYRPLVPPLIIVSNVRFAIAAFASGLPAASSVAGCAGVTWPLRRASLGEPFFALEGALDRRARRPLCRNVDRMHAAAPQHCERAPARVEHLRGGNLFGELDR